MVKLVSLKSQHTILTKVLHASFDVSFEVSHQIVKRKKQRAAFLLVRHLHLPLK